MIALTPNSELVDTVARDWIKNFNAAFVNSIVKERATAQAASAAMTDGLAGIAALAIASGHGSKAEIVEATVKSLRDAIDRDLMHIARWI